MSSKLLIALSFAGLLAFEWSGPLAWAHAYPKVSSPEDGSVVKEAPKEIRIQFTEGLELAFSRITVKGSNGEVISQGKLRQPANDTIAIDLKPLPPGNYTAEWQVLSVDTHITDGVVHFTVSGQGN